MKRLARKVLLRLTGADAVLSALADQRRMLAHAAWQQLLASPKYQDPKALARHGRKVYSQAEEDGILHEIFLRLPPGPRTFVEIGVSDGLECNTRLLLRSGWSGCWVEVDDGCANAVRRNFPEEIAAGRLRLIQKAATRDNMDALIAESGFAADLDLLSIDIDGNDYHLLEAMTVARPRAIVLEYNPVFFPPVEWVKNYDPQHRWDGSDRYGASLTSYARMLAGKGYALVGCTMNGNNAFFVRRDVLGDRFVDAPADHHFEPKRFWLTHAFD
jgi:hypothetical protein